MAIDLLQLTMTWAEDRALLRSNPSADPGAKTGDRADSVRPRLSSSCLRDWQQSEKPSRQDAAKSLTGCHALVTNDKRPTFQFTVNQHTTTMMFAMSKTMPTSPITISFRTLSVTAHLLIKRHYCRPQHSAIVDGAQPQ